MKGILPGPWYAWFGFSFLFREFEILSFSLFIVLLSLLAVMVLNHQFWLPSPSIHSRIFVLTSKSFSLDFSGFFPSPACSLARLSIRRGLRKFTILSIFIRPSSGSGSVLDCLLSECSNCYDLLAASPRAFVLHFGYCFQKVFFLLSSPSPSRVGTFELNWNGRDEAEWKREKRRGKRNVFPLFNVLFLSFFLFVRSSFSNEFSFLDNDFKFFFVSSRARLEFATLRALLGDGHKFGRGKRKSAQTREKV